ncbi:MAG TPA: electron transfer flavoprotein subunit beta/FixA family protein [Sulfuriferula sp.]|nr:electron transfer flavoprotein subunit beta/FixA family protein [Sulfuriferula sp.]
MHSVVCIKQVPDSAQIRIHPVTNTIMRQGVPAIINPYDLFALEEALRLKDRFGGKVTVISMGPSQAEPALRKALAYGADDAILITDKSFAGADTLATSYVLAAAIRQIAREEPVDMVFTGKQTIDGDTAQVGPGVAKRLELQLLTYVSRIVSVDPDKREIVVERRAEGGVQVLRTALPCLITMLEGSNAMRFGTMPDLFRAALHPLRQWDRTAAGIEDVTKVGLKGSPTIVNKVFTPTPRATRAEMITVDGGSSQDLAAALIARMGTLFPQVEKELAKRAR